MKGLKYRDEVGFKMEERSKKKTHLSTVTNTTRFPVTKS